MRSHHLFTSSPSDSPPNEALRHVRLVPARIVREADRPLQVTFDTVLDLDPAGSSGAKVGVIDTGVVVHDGRLHEFLRGHVIDPEHAVDPEDRIDPAGSYGHGTFVAGVILREAPSAELTMKAALDTSTGKWEDSAVTRSIVELGGAGVTLINLSFSGDAAETETPKNIVQALQGLSAETVVVAAAGNNGAKAGLVFPAAVTTEVDLDAMVIAVGAVDTTVPDVPPPVANFSGRGEWVSAFANGSLVLGPFQDAGWIMWSGTSFACATVTGRIAATMAADSCTAREAAAKVLALGADVQVTDGERSYPYVESKAGPLTINGESVPDQG